jgi:hypothetical protein
VGGEHLGSDGGKLVEAGLPIGGQQDAVGGGGCRGDKHVVRGPRLAYRHRFHSESGVYPRDAKVVDLDRQAGQQGLDMDGAGLLVCFVGALYADKQFHRGDSRYGRVIVAEDRVDVQPVTLDGDQDAGYRGLLAGPPAHLIAERRTQIGVGCRQVVGEPGIGGVFPQGSTQPVCGCGP